MTNEEFEKKMDAMTKKLVNLHKKAQDSGQQTKEDVKTALTSAQGAINTFTENARIASERGKSYASTELIKAQMTYKQKKDDLKKTFNEKKYDSDKAKLKAEAKMADEYAEFAIDYANYAADEASVAVLEATEKKMNFKEKYGEDPIDK